MSVTNSSLLSVLNNIIGTEYVGNDTVSSDNIEMLIKLLYSQCSLLQDLVKKYLAYNKENLLNPWFVVERA